MESVGLPSGTLYIPDYTFKVDYRVSRTTIWYPLYTRLHFLNRLHGVSWTIHLVPFIDLVTLLNRSWRSVGLPSSTLYIPGYTFKQITESVGLPSGTLYILGYTFKQIMESVDHHLVPFIC